MPDDDERERLWRKMLEGHAAETDAIAYGELAKRLQMSGGYIRNARSMRAGYLAAAQGSRSPPRYSLSMPRSWCWRDAGKVI